MVFIRKVFLSFIFIVFLNGCMPNFVAKYDVIIDKSITSLHKSTLIFLTKMELSSKSNRVYSKNKSFYIESSAIIKSLLTRSIVLEEKLNKKLLTKNFKDLNFQYLELQKEHKKGVGSIYFKGVSNSFNRSFGAIIKQLQVYKWNNSK